APRNVLLLHLPSWSDPIHVAERPTASILAGYPLQQHDQFLAIFRAPPGAKPWNLVQVFDALRRLPRQDPQRLAWQDHIRLNAAFNGALFAPGAQHIITRQHSLIRLAAAGLARRWRVLPARNRLDDRVSIPARLPPAQRVSRVQIAEAARLQIR